MLEEHNKQNGSIVSMRIKRDDLCERNDQQIIIIKTDPNNEETNKQKKKMK